MRDIFVLNEIWARDKIYFGRHFAWLKYFTYQLVQVLAPNYEQHILSPAKVSLFPLSQHAD
jgi:D-alanyl-lipoteichoic acid acyltransferase DltB (MBOAT superfamily)